MSVCCAGRAKAVMAAIPRANYVALPAGEIQMMEFALEIPVRVEVSRRLGFVS
jgi:hypothetical protein